MLRCLSMDKKKPSLYSQGIAPVSKPMYDSLLLAKSLWLTMFVCAARCLRHLAARYSVTLPVDCRQWLSMRL